MAPNSDLENSTQLWVNNAGICCGIVVEVMEGFHILEYKKKCFENNLYHILDIAQGCNSAELEYSADKV